jgi:hypothetical protein
MLEKASPLPIIVAVLLAAGCGGTARGTAESKGSSSANGAPEGGSTLATDARSAATGDIPDTQNFLTLRAPRLRVSMVYPEGWAVQESTSRLSITDKNDLVRISLSRGSAATLTSVPAELTALARSIPGLKIGYTHAISLKSGPAVKTTYTARSAPNPVTGKRVTLTVDRYVLAHAGRVAIVDLGTPVGVDNVDAYRRMIESFRWL